MRGRIKRQAMPGDSVIPDLRGPNLGHGKFRSVLYSSSLWHFSAAVYICCRTVDEAIGVCCKNRSYPRRVKIRFAVSELVGGKGTGGVVVALQIYPGLECLVSCSQIFYTGSAEASMLGLLCHWVSCLLLYSPPPVAPINNFAFEKTNDHQYVDCNGRSLELRPTLSWNLPSGRIQFCSITSQ